MKRGVYFHGFESTNLGDKIKYVVDNYNVYNPLLDYKKLTKDKVNIQTMYDLYRGYDFYIGSSMGGYVAFNLALKFNKPVLLLNPSLIYNNTHPFKPNYNHTYKSDMFILFGLNDKVVRPVDTLKTLDGLGLDYNSQYLNCGHRIPLNEFKDKTKKWFNDYA